MSHNHTPGHHHQHHHGPVVLTGVNRAFVVGIIFNFLFVIIEVIAGLYIHSLSLLSDAGHNLADTAALALALLAYRLLKVRSNERYTYGYRKTSILVALFNAAVLLVSIGAIMYEAIHRFLEPEPLPGKTIALIAGIGIVINFLTAILFMKNKDKDINIKSAYLHLMSDALVSIALVIGGIIIFYTHYYWIDSILSIIIATVILLGTWRLLNESLRLSLDGVPLNIDISNIRKAALKVPGIMDMHHIHIWAISTTENALTAHLVLARETTTDEELKIKNMLKHEIEHNNIHHITLETERDDIDCVEKIC